MIKLVNEIPTIAPDKIVEFVLHRGIPIKLDSPKIASEIKCPNCGCSEGSYLKSESAWGCKNEECFQMWKNINHPSMKTRPENLPPLYDKAFFETATFSEEIRRKCDEFIKNSNSFLLIGGLQGRGKTYLASCIINQICLMSSHSCFFLNVSEFYQEWKQKNDKNYFDFLIEKDVLILDDIGIKSPTDAFLDFLYSLCNFRMNHQKATIFTTNLDSKGMAEKLGAALTSRLCSGNIIKLEGTDFRVSNKK